MAPAIGRVPRRAAVIAVGLLLPVAAAAYFLREAGTPPGTATLSAVVDAPFAAVRAPARGRVIEVMASEGQTVSPDTPLFRVQAEELPSTGPSPAEALRMQQETAHTLLVTLDRRIADAEADIARRGAKPRDVEQARALLARLQDQRAAAARRAFLAGDAPPQAQTPSGPAVDEVKAGVTGLVWTVLAPAGADVTPGTALAQLADCSRPFLSLRQAPDLRPGQSVQLRFGTAPSVPATVRPPADGAAPGSATLDVDVAALRAATGMACPIGKSGTVTATVSPG